MLTSVTIRDVARRAGCSIATVSRVMNGTGSASAAMRQRVGKAVAELGFAPSEMGRSLVRRSRRILAVLVPSTTNPVFAASLAGFQERARAAGHATIIAQSDYDPARETEAVAALLTERPLGLVMTVCDPSSSRAIELARQAGVPFVLAYNEPDDPALASVSVDNAAAMEALAQHLLRLGHRRLVFVAGRFGASDRSRLRYAGFARALANAGIRAAPPFEVDFLEGAEDVDLTAAMDCLRPTAIVASNDLLALAVIAALRRLGLRVPQDVSVAGFDGIGIGRLVAPTLTTVEQRARDIGVSSASLLFDLVGSRPSPRRIRIEHRLWLGESTTTPSCAAIHPVSFPAATKEQAREVPQDSADRRRGRHRPRPDACAFR